MNLISSKSTENLSTMNYASTIKRAISLIKEETIKENELFECSEDLMLIPNLDEEIVPNTSALLTTDSFEIFSKVNVNPIFIRELLNIIQVVNFVWIASKNNIDLFHKTLLKLGIMFSYLFRNENNENDGVDYALLTPLPIIIYDFIARNGKNSFKYPNNFNFNEDFFSTEKNDRQIEYIYQENSVSQFLSNVNPKDIDLCPKIMFYLEYESAKELFIKQIFNSPNNFLKLPHNKKEFNGYNEIDLSFSLKNKVIIEENFTFNFARKKNNNFIEKSFSSGQKDNIIFEENSNIFIEIKYSIKNCDIEDVLNKLKNISNRFSNAYRNSAYSSLEKIFSKDKSSYFLFYDDNKIDLFNKIKVNLNIDKDIDICFNSVNVQLTSIVSLQNQIRHIKNVFEEKIEDLENKIESQANEIGNLKTERNIYDFRFSILEIKLLHINENSIISKIKDCIEKQDFSLLNCYENYKNKFMESFTLLSKIKPIDQIIVLSEQILGKEEIDNNYGILISLLNNKINNNTFAKDFYTAYRNSLVGLDYLLSGGKKCDFPVCTNLVANILNTMLKCIYLLDEDSSLLNGFYCAILFHASTLCQIDMKYAPLYIIKFNADNIKDTVIYLIQSINPSLLMFP